MRYRHVFFDLDHTLWDFDKNAAESLGELYLKYALHRVGNFSENDFINQFLRVNNQLWDQYNVGKLTQQQLRETRFTLVLEALGISDFPECRRLGEDYLHISPQKPHLIPFAKEVLEYLRQKYALHLITNGFSDMQAIKTNSAGITSYFQEVITSERAGCRKPQRKIFDYALQVTRAEPEESVMIGDSWDCDMVGARNAGLDHIFYNPSGTKVEASPTFEIRCLSELFRIL
jgi:putative hydrolase of the HAD superfamily